MRLYKQKSNIQLSTFRGKIHGYRIVFFQYLAKYLIFQNKTFARSFLSNSSIDLKRKIKFERFGSSTWDVTLNNQGQIQLNVQFQMLTLTTIKKLSLKNSTDGMFFKNVSTLKICMPTSFHIPIIGSLFVRSQVFQTRVVIQAKKRPSIYHNSCLD